MILAVDRGESPEAVALNAQCSRATVYYWVHRYQQHRDVRVLAIGQTSTQEARNLRVAKDLNEMKGRRLGKPSLLRWDDRAKASMRLDARIATDATDRLKAAILWAVDRHVPMAHVAHVLGMARTSVYRVLERANSAGKIRRKPKVRLISANR